MAERRAFSTEELPNIIGIYLAFQGFFAWCIPRPRDLSSENVSCYLNVRVWVRLQAFLKRIGSKTTYRRNTTVTRVVVQRGNEKGWVECLLLIEVDLQDVGVNLARMARISTGHVLR